jgi:hypothetical protein
MTGVKEVTVTGRTVVSSARRVPGTWVAGATERGLVLARRRGLFVWDPVSGRRFDWPGRRPPADRSARSFPDGTLLAKPKLGRRQAGKRTWHLELIDSRSGTSTAIPGSTTGEWYPDPRWSPSSGWLFFRAGRTGLKAYRPGAQRAITIDVAWPRKATSYAAG